MKGAEKPSPNGSAARHALVATLTLIGAVASPAIAQQEPDAVTTYRLPDPNRTPTPRVQGPVDPDNPIPSPSSAPTPSSPAISAPRVTLPPPRATPTQTATPRSSERQQPARSVAKPSTEADTASTAPRPATTPRSSDIAPEPSPTVSPAPAPIITAGSDSDDPNSQPSAAPTEANSTADDAASSNLLIPGAFGAGLLGLGAFFLLRRRRRAADVEDEPLFAPAPADPVSLPSTPASTPRVTAAPAIEEASSIPASLVAEPLAIATNFVAKAVRLSLVYATVQYELEVANTGTTEMPALQVRADLASAHASLGTREQLSPAPEQLEAKHALAALGAGETTVLKGEVRVPLQYVRTVTKGAAQFFVPLVRFAILAPDGTGMRRVYTTGPRDPGSGTIALVRLDAGPRNLRDLDAREIEAARGFALDPEIAHS